MTAMGMAMVMAMGMGKDRDWVAKTLKWDGDGDGVGVIPIRHSTAAIQFVLNIISCTDGLYAKITFSCKGPVNPSRIKETSSNTTPSTRSSPPFLEDSCDDGGDGDGDGIDTDEDGDGRYGMSYPKSHKHGNSNRN